jgi:hypothetical protein
MSESEESELSAPEAKPAKKTLDEANSEITKEDNQLVVETSDDQR